MPTATNEWYFSGIAWYYGDEDFIIQTCDSIARSDAAHVTCSTDTNRMTCGTDTNSHVTSSKKYVFL